MITAPEALPAGMAERVTLTALALAARDAWNAEQETRAQRDATALVLARWYAQRAGSAELRAARLQFGRAEREHWEAMEEAIVADVKVRVAEKSLSDALTRCQGRH